MLRIKDNLQGLGEVQTQGTVSHKGRSFPLLSFHFGKKDSAAPTLIFVAGVHGLEKIGTQILLSFLESWLQLLKWDTSLQALLKTSQVIFYPIANPIGMSLNMRSNGNGVDLMRNGGQQAEGKTYPFISGHKISRHLPWYRGYGYLEKEAEVLCAFIQNHAFHAGPSLVLDIHSGFGLKDSLWLPYAGSTKPFPEAARVLALKQLFDQSYPHHTYSVEPQHFSYRTHGDLWDHLVHLHQLTQKTATGGPFIPLCLEIGSWIWLRKNPRQIFSSLGLFNPILPHRVKRAERRHFLLLNFLLKAIGSPDAWVNLSERRYGELDQSARIFWYGEHELGR